ncbi:MAG TPA: hypothetical protein VFZ34_20235 [Blastocatellia bacterium]|nr:hypothetical protein [Blastocatellia bacterium]
MTQVKLIKREAVTKQAKRVPNPVRTARATVQEWVNQYQTAKPHSTRTTFTALFAEAHIG